jgi:hypothetical protein
MNIIIVLLIGLTLALFAYAMYELVQADLKQQALNRKLNALEARRLQ